VIVTVTPNVALDRTLLVRGYAIGGTHRASEVLLVAGGKGPNVARVARALGVPALALGLVGGVTGRLFAEMATREGLPTEFVWIAGETRNTINVVDPDAPSSTLINEPGPVVNATEWEAFAALVRARAAGSDLVTFNGSLPRGVPAEALADLARALCAAGVRLVIDTSGEALRLSLSVAPWLVKVNGEEAGEALGWPVRALADAQRAAREMRERGAQMVILTLGADGAVVSSPEGDWWAVPPTVRALCPVGSGDALLAGWAVGLLQGKPLSEALRLAVAVAAANELTLGAGYFRQDDLDRLLPQVQVQRLG